MNARDKLIEEMSRKMKLVSDDGWAPAEAAGVLCEILTPKRIAELAWGEMNEDERNFTANVRGVAGTYSRKPMPFYDKMLEGGEQ